MEEVIIYPNVEEGDFVRCNNCGKVMLLPYGSDICPECGKEGCLAWADDSIQETNESELRAVEEYKIFHSEKEIKYENCFDDRYE